MRPLTLRGLLPWTAVLLLAASAPAQQPGRHALSRSLAPGSPDLPGQGRAGDVIVANSTRHGAGGVEWPHQELGLLQDHNVDAFSDGSDIFPISGPAVVTPPVSCGWLLAEYTVDPASDGVPGEVVNLEVLDDGAESDTFAVHYTPSTTQTLHTSDHLDIDPATDIDSLNWFERRRYPVFFSVDAATAVDLGVSPAAILVSNGGGTHSVWREPAALGLVPGDDIDALAVDLTSDPTEPRIVLSLARQSPSLTSLPALAPVSAAGLAISVQNTMEAWMLPSQLHLEADSDELNGARITDPLELDWLDCTQTDPDTGWPASILRVDGTIGNIRHMVDVGTGDDFEVAVRPLTQDTPLLIFWTIGRPCYNDHLPVGFIGTLTFAPVLPSFFIVGDATLSMTLNTAGVDVSLHGMLQDPVTGARHLTNALTIRPF